MRSRVLSRASKCLYSTGRGLPAVPKLPYNLDVFRSDYFAPGRPAQVDKTSSSSIAAPSKWFSHAGSTPSLDIDYLEPHGQCIVPLELTHNTNNGARFSRADRPLAEFLAYAKLRETNETDLHVYIAQCPLNSLPMALQADLAMPEIVKLAGKGDVYDSSIWMGHAPTYTPLHKDPNPNLFVQLAGRKRVRLFEPDVGLALYRQAATSLGRGTGAAMRGEEMMQGPERDALEHSVWAPDGVVAARHVAGLEAVLEAGDALFIPTGWWHSIKGIGRGMNGSVNWWFR